MKKLLFYNMLAFVLFFMSCAGEKSVEKEIVVARDNSWIEVSDEQFSAMKMQISPLQ